MRVSFDSKIIKYPGFAAWFFVPVTKDLSEKIKSKNQEKKKGFGSLRVKVQLGKSIWETSIFPDSRSVCYLLPLKKEIRKKEDLYENESVSIKLEIL